MSDNNATHDTAVGHGILRTMLLEVLAPAAAVGTAWLFVGNELAKHSGSYLLVGLVTAAVASLAGGAALLAGQGVNDRV